MRLYRPSPRSGCCVCRSCVFEKPEVVLIIRLWRFPFSKAETTTNGAKLPPRGAKAERAVASRWRQGGANRRGAKVVPFVIGAITTRLHYFYHSPFLRMWAMSEALSVRAKPREGLERSWRQHSAPDPRTTAAASTLERRCQPPALRGPRFQRTAVPKA